MTHQFSCSRSRRMENRDSAALILAVILTSWYDFFVVAVHNVRQERTVCAQVGCWATPDVQNDDGTGKGIPGTMVSPMVRNDSDTHTHTAVASVSMLCVRVFVLFFSCFAAKHQPMGHPSVTNRFYCVSTCLLFVRVGSFVFSIYICYFQGLIPYIFFLHVCVRVHVCVYVVIVFVLLMFMCCGGSIKMS